MKHKEKALELFDKCHLKIEDATAGLFEDDVDYTTARRIAAKQCALIVCDEFIDAMTITHIGYCKGAFNNYYKNKKDYWL